MFFSKIETDKYGHQQVHFYLTQGDTGTIKSTPTQNGELIDLSNVVKCVFKLADSDNNGIFSQDFKPEDDVFSVTLESKDTANFPIDTLTYEVEYTFVDGVVNTPNRWKFDVLEQNND